MTTQRLRFVLDGDDDLTPVLNRAGDSSARLHRRLGDDMDGNTRAVRGFTQDADGRLRDLRGRFISVSDAQRMMAAGIPAVTRRLGDVSSAGGDAAASLGRSGGGLTGTMIGVAAVAGMSLLPALGAVVPALAGVGLAAGTLKLGFAGIPEALDAQAKGHKEYAEALKKLPKPAQDFTKELVSLKKEFGGIGKDIQKAMLPGFTKALKDAEPTIKLVGKAMSDMGAMFGDAAEGVGRLLKDSGFQKDLQTNLKLGTGFIRDMTSAMGPFTRSLLDFGAASGPTLKSLSDGIGGLLTKGLPGMFDGLKTGIPGTASMLNGLFSAINDILPAIGRLAGEMGRTLGPVFGEQFQVGGKALSGALDLVRGALIALRPVIRDIGFGFKSILDLGKIIGPTMVDVGAAIIGGLAPVGQKVNETAGPLQRLNQAINDNKIGIMETARMFGIASIDIAGFAIKMVPVVIGGFRQMATIALTALDGIVSGAAHAFGWVPGLGDKLKGANKAFDSFKSQFLSGLSQAEQKANQFAAAAEPKLAAGKLKLNIDNWSQQLAEAKKKLATVPPSKQAALKANIADLASKIASATRQLNALDGKTATTWIYTNYAQPHHMATGGLARLAGGGRVQGFPGGGPVAGPGTSTSDSIPAMLSNGEFVINAASTRRYFGLVNAINDDRLDSTGGMRHVIPSGIARPAATPVPVLGRPAAGGGRSGGNVYNVSITVHDPMDPVGVAREMQRVLIQLGRAQGSTITLIPGG